MRKEAVSSLLVVDEEEVWVTRKRIKNITLRVKPPYGQVEISAPLYTNDRTLEALVRERHTWIKKRREDIVSSPSSKAAKASSEEKEEWRMAVQAHTPGLIAHWERVMGVKAGKVVYRNMTSRWGSCQPSTGRICINTRLALYPPECLEYVVVHELCHLLERGHGSRFKELMTTFLPGWRGIRAKLR